MCALLVFGLSSIKTQIYFLIFNIAIVSGVHMLPTWLTEQKLDFGYV